MVIWKESNYQGRVRPLGDEKGPDVMFRRNDQGSRQGQWSHTNNR